MSMSKEQAIYRFIRKKGAASKQDLVMALGYSLPTITQKLQSLEKKNLIDTSDKIENTGGRNAIAYSYVSNAKAAIGVYLTDHHISCLAVDLSGKVICTKRIHRLFDLKDDEYWRALGVCVEAVKEEAEIMDSSLLGVGISVPGLVSEDCESVVYGRTIGITGMTRKEIAKYIPYHNRIFHDSVAAGFREIWESGKSGNAFCITLNNSVGGVFIQQGDQIYQGNNHRGAEIGHLLVEPENGAKCYCGNCGCLDTVCRSTILSEYTDGNIEKFFELLDGKDPGAEKLWKSYIKYLARAIRNIRLLFDCDIILSGYVGAYIEKYMPQLCAEVDSQGVFGDKAADYVIPARNKTEDIAAGAAILLIDEYLSEI